MFSCFPCNLFFLLSCFLVGPLLCCFLVLICSCFCFFFYLLLLLLAFVSFLDFLFCFFLLSCFLVDPLATFLLSCFALFMCYFLVVSCVVQVLAVPCRFSRVVPRRAVFFHTVFPCRAVCRVVCVVRPFPLHWCLLSFRVS